MGSGGEAGGDDAQGERELPDGADEGFGGDGLAGDAVLPDDAGEQLQRAVLVEHVELDAVGAGQRGEAGAAGDEDGAAPAAGEQRQDLALSGGVVEDDEDAAGGEPGAVHLGALVEGFGDELARDAEGAQEAPEDLDGGGGGAGGAAQVAVELSVGEAGLGEGVGDVHGEGGLAGAGLAGDRGERDGAASVATGEGLLQGGEALSVGDEVGDVGGQLVRDGVLANRFSSGRRGGLGGCRGLLRACLGGRFGGSRGGHGGRRGGVRRREFAREDGGFEVAEFAAGFKSELVGEVAAGGAEGFEGLGLASGPVEGLDELPVELLAERVFVGEALEFAHEPVVAAEFELDADAELDGGEAFLVELAGLVGERAAVESGEAFALPEGDGGPEEADGLLGVTALAQRAGALDEAGEEGGVDVPGVGVQHVARGPGHQGDLTLGAGEQLAQPGHADLHLGTGGLRRVVLPDEVHELTGAHHPVALQEQRGEDHLLPARRDAQRPGGSLNLEWPQHPEGQARPALDVLVR